MIQDIDPYELRNQMRFADPRPGDTVLAYRERSLLVSSTSGQSVCPAVASLTQPAELIYLFSLAGPEGEERFFLGMPQDTDPEASLAVSGYEYLSLRSLRERRQQPLQFDFAAMTGFQLYRWYHDNRWCGRCGKRMRPDVSERALTCDDCGNKVYPRIMPAVIVAVVDGSRILVSRYAQGAYRGYALIAGFCEIGETAEQTVAREVMEETGVSVKNIRYYKSQPWGIASDLLLGYFCELDGSPQITLDTNELSEAEWLDRADMDGIEDDNYSLTREMMMRFKRADLPFLR